MPGGVIVRVQVKHFYANSGPLGKWVVNQLANSMDIGENGIIVTSGTIDAKAEALAQRYTAEKNKNIEFINGQELVHLLFQNLDQLSEEELLTFGLAKKVMLF